MPVPEPGPAPAVLRQAAPTRPRREHGLGGLEHRQAGIAGHDTTAGGPSSRHTNIPSYNSRGHFAHQRGGARRAGTQFLAFSDELVQFEHMTVSPVRHAPPLVRVLPMPPPTPAQEIAHKTVGRNVCVSGTRYLGDALSSGQRIESPAASRRFAFKALLPYG